MANKTISLMGTVKENKNNTLYIDVAEGRVFLGKVSGFIKGQQIMGEAICSQREVSYPATPAIGVEGQPNYRAAQAARTEIGWSVENFYSEEMMARKAELDAKKALATFNIAKINKATSAIATLEVTTAADIFAMVG